MSCEGTQSTSEALSAQWRNPSDILSLLLLIGGDIVQKALAQLTGYCIKPGFGGRGAGRRNFHIPLAPVAFSFGWVAFGFTSLTSVLGKQQLMPAVERPALVMNCANSFARDNQSWLLERLLRDHEARHERDTKTGGSSRCSMRIDIFELGPFGEDEEVDPVPDRVWWTGWLTIVAQLCLSVVPWVRHGNWGVLLVLACGTVLALVTGAMPQWRREKWAGAKLERHSVHVLARGNGQRYVMVFIGSPNSYNLEVMATAKAQRHPETPIITCILAALWAGLLVCTSGLNQDSWFMVGIGGLGMIQNVYTAGASTSTGWTALKIKPFGRKPTIIAQRVDLGKDDDNASVDLQRAKADMATLDHWIDSGGRADQKPRWLDTMKPQDGTPLWLQPAAETDIARAQGALKELEKWVPTAGLALLTIFFPGSLKYDDSTIRDNVNKKFWNRAWHTKRTRRRAEHARKKLETLRGREGP